MLKEQFKQYLKFRNSNKIKYISNAISQKEIKQLENGINSMFKFAKCLKDKNAFKHLLLSDFEKVEFRETSIFLGDYELVKTPNSIFYLNAFALVPTIKRLEIEDLDKAIYLILAGFVFGKDINEYIEKYKYIEADSIQKQQRLQELAADYTGIEIIKRDRISFKAISGNRIIKAYKNHIKVYSL